MCLFRQSAFHLLQAHCQVCADRIGIIGLSFGVYLTLRIATKAVVKVCPKGLSLSSILNIQFDQYIAQSNKKLIMTFI